MNQDNYGCAFKKLKLTPKTLAIAAGAGLLLGGALPARAYDIQHVDADDAVIVASTTTSVTVTSTVTITSSVTVTTTTTTSSTSSAVPGKTTIAGAAFNQPTGLLDLSTTT
jgi:hypothetical protein